MKISFIVAVGLDGAIGDQGRLPWRLPSDLERFRQLTMGHPVLMGRKTHEAIGKPLDGRTNIVLSRDPDYRAPGCSVVGRRDAAVSLACRLGAEKAFVIGGAEIYRLFADLCEELHFTRVAGKFGGDAVFPEDAFADRWSEWEITGEEQIYRDDNPGDSHDSLYRVFAKREAP